MTLLNLRDALLTVTNKAYHYEPPEGTSGSYIVWAEDGQADAVHGDNRMQTQALTGTVDYFTKTEYDANVQKIQKALSDAKIPWRLESVQYEDETGYIHHEFVWQIEVDPHG